VISTIDIVRYIAGSGYTIIMIASESPSISQFFSELGTCFPLHPRWVRGRGGFEGLSGYGRFKLAQKIHQ
jgi:hypothetical protein